MTGDEAKKIIDNARKTCTIADLRGADLRGANLGGANLNYSCLPLWCGGQGAKIDARLARQFLAHALAFDVDADVDADAAAEYARLREAAREFCGGSHIANYMDWLKEAE